MFLRHQKSLDIRVFFVIKQFIHFICLQNLGEIPHLHGLEEDQSLEDEMNLRVLGYKAFR